MDNEQSSKTLGDFLTWVRQHPEIDTILKQHSRPVVTYLLADFQKFQLEKRVRDHIFNKVGSMILYGYWLRDTIEQK